MPDLDTATWTVLGVIGTLIAVAAGIVGAWFGRTQAKESREAGLDRRLDDKVNAVVGSKIIAISNLTDQAKAAVDEAKAGAAEVSQLQESIQQVRQQTEQLNQDLQDQRRQADQGRTQLEESLRTARSLRQQLDQVARQANADARIVSTARKRVEADQQLLNQVRSIVLDVGYTIPDESTPFIDVLAAPPDDWPKAPYIIIETKRLVGSNVPATLSRSAKGLLTIGDGVKRHQPQPKEIETHGLLLLIVVDRDVTEHEIATVSSLKDKVHIVPVDSLRDYLNTFPLGPMDS